MPSRPSQDKLDDALQEYTDVEGLFPAIVTEASPQSVKAYLKGGETVDLAGDGLRFAQSALGDKVPLAQRIRRGSIIRLMKDDKGRWQVSQIPEVEGALVSIDPVDGRIIALVGGFDFNRNKFNHVTQALRQPGSSFKPFIYSAALEKGFTAATVINDAPLRFEAGQTGSAGMGAEELRWQLWRADATTRRSGKVEESGVGANHAGDWTEIRAGLHRSFRIRSQAESAVF